MNKGQVLTGALYDAIQLEAQQAVAYLPAEDKINLALGLTAAPVIDRKDDLKALALETQAKLQEANKLITQLQASGATVGTTNP